MLSTLNPANLLRQSQGTSSEQNLIQESQAPQQARNLASVSALVQQRERRTNQVPMPEEEDLADSEKQGGQKKKAEDELGDYKPVQQEGGGNENNSYRL
mmetsp:Transcript_11458/g.19388  ORF Transcript_11458/g.19388 Transcript_11458/m.19388 type:complete len:99 (+) Transcript_11458:1017-1313(+)